MTKSVAVLEVNESTCEERGGVEHDTAVNLQIVSLLR